MKWFVKCIKNYANFSGRARRMEYWMFYLISQIIGLIIVIPYLITFFSAFDFNAATFSPSGAYWFFFILLVLYSLFLLLPSLAVAVRRLHDTGRSGGWWFIQFVPLIGTIWFIVLLVLPGDVGDNRFGPDPKA